LVQTNGGRAPSAAADGRPFARLALRRLRSGDEALRHLSRDAAVWLIHIDLPDMSGLDLCEHLRARRTEAPICLLDETYHPRRERAAYRRGATLYACKPITAEWLSHWLPEMAPA